MPRLNTDERDTRISAVRNDTGAGEGGEKKTLTRKRRRRCWVTAAPPSVGIRTEKGIYLRAERDEWSPRRSRAHDDLGTRRARKSERRPRRDYAITFFTFPGLREKSRSRHADRPRPGYSHPTSLPRERYIPVVHTNPPHPHRESGRGRGRPDIRDPPVEITVARATTTLRRGPARSLTCSYDALGISPDVSKCCTREWPEHDVSVRTKVSAWRRRRLATRKGPREDGTEKAGVEHRSPDRAIARYEDGAHAKRQPLRTRDGGKKVKTRSI